MGARTLFVTVLVLLAGKATANTLCTSKTADNFGYFDTECVDPPVFYCDDSYASNYRSSGALRCHDSPDLHPPRARLKATTLQCR